MSKFITELDAMLIKDDLIWKLERPLIYESDLLGPIMVPEGFETDFASVPRLPVIYTLWGARAHREAVIHDYLYRTDSVPEVSFETANSAFLEAMECRGKSWYIRWPMYLAVKFGGFGSYHVRKVRDKL
jgi:hypothetical protein